ncbi:MAG TPA: futalosine hydrolase [Segetibacter sp.]|jgi:futalosine hydrolase
MRVVITSATVNEWAGVNENINPLYTGESSRLQVSFHKSGVGILATTFSLSKLIVEVQPDLIIQIGIAGTFEKNLLGKLVVVKDELLGDLGVEENYQFKDVFDLKLEAANEYPFRKKKLPNVWLEKFSLLNLSEVSSITVNEITTREERIHQLQKKYNPQIESMEGAALHYVGLLTNTPFIQIRAVSNMVGERDKSKWQMNEALSNLTTTTLKLIERLYKLK